MIVVSDTSPISSLFLINRLALLPAIFGQVIVPEKVYSELLILETKFGYDLSALKSASWLEIREVTDVQAVNRLKEFLDDGESEAIVLAKKLNVDYLLIDEHEGRQFAVAEGLRIIGVLGLFIKAKDLGLIPFVKPLMDDLRTIAKFRISEELFRRVLEQVKE